MNEQEMLDLFHGGKCINAYNFFGCHKNASGGYTFRVWAPHALRVSVVGSFNGWDENSHVMQRLCDEQSFEAHIECAKLGDQYKFCIFTADDRKIYKADPFAFYSNFPSTTNSVIYELPSVNKPLVCDKNLSQPINIYEVNLLSWKRHEDNSYYSYLQLIDELVPYVRDMGYTHVEFMPITEYPFDGSWGYQVTGYYSIVARLGTPDEFARLVNAFHGFGIKVILDWVPAHFPKDDFGLYEFDGQPLYESQLWHKMEYRKWGTRAFDFGKCEVVSFLLSSAVFLLKQYAFDGLRVDAVASMLYLDYDKNADEWLPNSEGNNLNLEAIAFIKQLSSVLNNNFPHALLIAEDSSAYGGITTPVTQGGLGFDYKWNMGWMNDVLFYCRQDPLFRRYHHNKLTFSMMYSLNENYILPLSHDEVVHVKGSILNKMPGEYENKFSGERLLLGFMYAHVGKKLNFMGYEFAQFNEWNFSGGLDHFLCKFELHNKMKQFVKSLNYFYKNCRPLYEVERSWSGFEWLVVDDEINNVIVFNRYDLDGNCLLCVCNFSGIDLQNYTFGQHEGKYLLAFNSDCVKFGGKGSFRKRVLNTKKLTSHGKEFSITMDIPKLTCMYFLKQKNK